MKISIILWPVLFTVSVAIQAQQSGMSQEQMEQLMQQAQQMQTCMARVDQQELMALGQQAQAMDAKMRSLCQAGKRSKAQSTAIKFGIAMSRDENVQAARECGEMMRGMIPKMDYPTSEKDFKGGHVCDAY